MGVGYLSGRKTKDRRDPIIMPWEPVEYLEKWCPKCRLFVAKAEFYASSRNPDGLEEKCKLCDHAKRSRNRKKKREREKAKS